MGRECLTREQVVDRLRRKRINMTQQRLEIAVALFSRMEHLSADQILTEVNREHAAVSKATVYNTLRLFVEKGLIREVIVDPERIFYDPNTNPHHHMYEIETGRLTDVSLEEFDVVGRPCVPSGLTIDGIDVIVRVRKSLPLA